MLVLTRKTGEQIRIGDSIIVTVTRVQGNRVGIGIQAPPQVLIQRTERQPRAADHGDSPEHALTAVVAGAGAGGELSAEQDPPWILPLRAGQ